MKNDSQFSESNIKSRIRMLLTLNRITVRDIVGGDSAMEQRVSRQMNESKMNIDTFLLLVSAIPVVDYEWLLFGRGKMPQAKEYNTEDTQKTVVSEETDNGTIALLKEQLKTKDEQISHLLQVLTSFNK